MVCVSEIWRTHTQNGKMGNSNKSSFKNRNETGARTAFTILTGWFLISNSVAKDFCRTDERKELQLQYWVRFNFWNWEIFFSFWIIKTFYPQTNIHVSKRKHDILQAKSDLYLWYFKCRTFVLICSRNWPFEIASQKYLREIQNHPFINWNLSPNVVICRLCRFWL